MKNTLKITSTIMAVSLMAASSLALADDDDNIDPATLAISMEQATAIAKQQVEGTVVSAEAEMEDSVTVWEVEILDAEGITYEVEIDASNGTVLEVEKDD